MKAEILSIGHEVVSGVVADTNAAYLSRRLEELGATVVGHRAVRDLEPEIVGALRAASEAAELVIVTGGLGPTADDLTREAAAAFTGRALATNPRAVELLREFLARRNRVPDATNMKQTRLPGEAELLPNLCGTAPGFALQHQGVGFIFLPGVPREMMAMFEEEAVPRLRKLLPQGRNLCRTLVVFGLPEAAIGARLADLMRRGANPEVGTVVTSGVVQVRIVARDKDLASAREKVEAVATQARRLLGVAVIGEGDATLPSAVAELLERTGRTIAIAESCTGGLVAGMLTEEAGISRFFLEGVVAYSNAAKTRLLGVPEALLNAYGAVSLQAASAMARGVREKSRADIGVAITGIAGPGGGTREKPAGTVCFALDDDAGTITREERFAGDRAEVRDRAAKTALNMVRVRLLGARR